MVKPATFPHLLEYVQAHEAELGMAVGAGDVLAALTVLYGYQAVRAQSVCWNLQREVFNSDWIVEAECLGLGLIEEFRGEAAGHVGA